MLGKGAGMRLEGRGCSASACGEREAKTNCGVATRLCNSERKSSWKLVSPLRLLSGTDSSLHLKARGILHALLPCLMCLTVT